MPAGTVEVSNSYGMTGYGGACPPPGDPAPRLSLYALRPGDGTNWTWTKIRRPPKVIFMAGGHVLGKTGLTAFLRAVIVSFLVDPPLQ